jgi:hypothetical protein
MKSRCGRNFTALDRCVISNKWRMTQVAAPAAGRVRSGGEEALPSRSAPLSAYMGYVERARGMPSYQSSGMASFAWLAFQKQTSPRWDDLWK